MAEKMPNALKSSTEDVAVSMYSLAESKEDEEDSGEMAEWVDPASTAVAVPVLFNSEAASTDVANVVWRRVGVDI